MTPSAALAIRLGLVALITVLVQISAVSQVSLLGVSADLSPLVVASVGLLCGSVPGAVMGFFVGLFADTALLQTLGVSSLVLLLVGYWAGRLRELRDPAHALTPLAVGAAATAAASIGFSLLQFLLGVDAPVSLLLLRDILVTILVNAALAIPVYALVRRALLPVLPEDPRRRRRRAYVTGGLSPISRA
ncbi:MAG: rod shape-determining protein MreD [Actinomycetota bacterium]|nr:rod shape-determining protein MreD [Actinomycetota bacterium]